jgi:endonuclease YncB( thermonuclease family)
VIDGETVSVAGTWVRLVAVDVAELGTRWGDMAKLGMTFIVGNELSCQLTGQKIGRMEVGSCSKPDGTDIAQELVANGYALACPRYDDHYVRFEQPETEAAKALRTVAGPQPARPVA